jgi:hypothetical protein
MVNDHDDLVMIVMGYRTLQAAFAGGNWKVILGILPAYLAHLDEH